MIARLKLYAGAVLAVIAFILTFGGMKKREGRKEVQHEFEKDKSRRVAAGRDKVRKGRDSGLSPSERIKKNDDEWGGA